jgi:hypothetical protein
LLIVRIATNPIAEATPPRNPITTDFFISPSFIMRFIGRSIAAYFT